MGPPRPGQGLCDGMHYPMKKKENLSFFLTIKYKKNIKLKIKHNQRNEASNWKGKKKRLESNEGSNWAIILLVKLSRKRWRWGHRIISQLAAPAICPLNLTTSPAPSYHSSLPSRPHLRFEVFKLLFLGISLSIQCVQPDLIVPDCSLSVAEGRDPPHRQIQMITIPYLTALTTYFSYGLLFAFGQFRDFFRKIFDWWKSTDLQVFFSFATLWILLLFPLRNCSVTWCFVWVFRVMRRSAWD